MNDDFDDILGTGRPTDRRRDGRSSGSYRDRQTYVLPRPRHIRSSEHRWHWGGWLAVLVILAALAGLGAWFNSFEYGTETSVVFTVKNLDDQSTGSSGHQYLVFTYLPGTTTPGEVFKNTDAWFHGKTNSSDIQSALVPGHTYRCTVYGKRRHLTSSYRDILVCSGYDLATHRETPLLGGSGG
jgi:hypothetical protein